MLVLLDVALVNVLLNEYIMMIMMTVEYGRIKCVAYSEKTKLCCVFLAFCTVCFSVWSRLGLGLCANYVRVHSGIHALYGG